MRSFNRSAPQPIMKSPSRTMEALYLAHRSELLAFFRRRGATDVAEDLLHELWMRLPIDDSHIHNPLSYLFRCADSLVINRFISERRSRNRDTTWNETTGPAIGDQSEQPAPDRVLEGREAVAEALRILACEGDRVRLVFLRHRLDGLTQREVANEIGVSISTVESDLRRAYRVIYVLKKKSYEV